jgi:hypothetical protein
MNFKQYKRKGLSEMISVKEFIANGGDMTKVSISSPDHLLQTHDPEEFAQGFVARNPKNHADLWYVAKKYFDDNLEEVAETTSPGPFGSLHMGRGNFGQAVEAAKQGKKVARIGWNGAGMYAVIMPGYPNGIEANEATRKTHNLPEGSILKFRPYWQLFTAQKDIAMWSPSGSDSLAEDWMIVD